MEERRDRLILVGTVFERDGARPEQMADVRDLSILANLSGMQPRGRLRGAAKPLPVHRPRSGRRHSDQVSH